MLGAIKAFDSLVRLVDSRIIPHLNLLLPPLAQRALSSDGTEVMNVLRNIEIAVVDSYANGLEGRSTLRSDCDLVLKIIKQKIPTYVSVYF